MGGLQIIKRLWNTVLGTAPASASSARQPAPTAAERDAFAMRRREFLCGGLAVGAAAVVGGAASVIARPAAASEQPASSPASPGSKPRPGIPPQHNPAETPEVSDRMDDASPPSNVFFDPQSALKLVPAAVRLYCLYIGESTSATRIAALPSKNLMYVATGLHGIATISDFALATALYAALTSQPTSPALQWAKFALPANLYTRSYLYNDVLPKEPAGPSKFPYSLSAIAEIGTVATIMNLGNGSSQAAKKAATGLLLSKLIALGALARAIYLSPATDDLQA